MSRYLYRAQNRQGSLQDSHIDAGSIDEAIDSLARQDLTIVTIREETVNPPSKKADRIFPKVSLSIGSGVSQTDVSLFTRQLSTAIDAGVPLVKAMTRLARSRKGTFKIVLDTLVEQLSAGKSFSESLLQHPRVFPPMFSAVVKAGEQAGTLSEALDGVAHYNETYLLMRRKVVGALRYPIFVLLVIVFMFVAILWKLVPVFEGMYQGFGAKLPLPTQTLIWLSHIFRDNLPVMLLGAIGVLVVWFFAIRVTAVKTMVSRVLFKAPIFGKILTDSVLVLFCKTMALLLRNGAPIIDAVVISGEVVHDPLYTAGLKRVALSLASGQPLSELLDKSKLFPDLVVQMVATGEETGRLAELLDRAGLFYEQEMTVTVDSLSQLIEPVLILFLGSVAGAVVLALYLPVFSLGSLISGQ